MLKWLDVAIRDGFKKYAHETHYLLSTRANAKRLRDSIKQLDR